MRRLDPRVVHLWRLQSFVRLLTFWAPVTVGVGLFAWSDVGFEKAAAGAGTLLGLLVAHAIFWPHLRWARFRFGVREHDLLVESGVLLRHTVSIPRDRIQHVDTRQGPLERMLGVSRVIVYTAAGMAADGSIPGLEEAEANRLRDTLARPAAAAARGDGV